MPTTPAQLPPLLPTYAGNVTISVASEVLSSGVTVTGNLALDAILVVSGNLVVTGDLVVDEGVVIFVRPGGSISSNNLDFLKNSVIVIELEKSPPADATSVIVPIATFQGALTGVPTFAWSALTIAKASSWLH